MEEGTTLENRLDQVGELCEQDGSDWEQGDLALGMAKKTPSLQILAAAAVLEGPVLRGFTVLKMLWLLGQVLFFFFTSHQSNEHLQ